MKNKELKFRKPKKRSTKNGVYTLLPTGANEIKCWKPHLLQRFMYWTKIMKDPRYNGKKLSYYHLDEVGQWDDSTCR